MAKRRDSPRFDGEVITAACKDAEPEAIVDLCDSICAALRARPSSDKHPVARDGQISDSEAANFAYRMLRACSREGTIPPSELADLFQIILAQDRPPAGGDRRYVQKEEARRYVAGKPDAGVREIALAVGVNASTVSRWRAKGLLR